MKQMRKGEIRKDESNKENILICCPFCGNVESIGLEAVTRYTTAEGLDDNKVSCIKCDKEYRLVFSVDVVSRSKKRSWLSRLFSKKNKDNESETQLA